MKTFFFTMLIYSVILMSFSCTQKSRLYTIGFVQIVDDPGLDEGRRGVLDALKDAGYEDGKNISVVYRNAQGDMPTVQLILRSFLNNKVDMVITNSTPCMVAASKVISEIPVVFTVAFGPQQLGIQTPKNLSGVYDPLVMDEWFSIIRSLIPSLKRVGILYNSSEPNALFGARAVKEECSRQGIEVAEVQVVSSADILQGASALAEKNIQAIVVAADNTVHLGLSAVVKVSYEKKIPLFVKDPTYVSQGAVMGLGAEYYEWGIESGRIAAEIISTGAPEKGSIRPISSKMLILNKTAAGKTGIVFPDSLLKKAGKIIE